MDEKNQSTIPCKEEVTSKPSEPDVKQALIARRESLAKDIESLAEVISQTQANIEKLQNKRRALEEALQHVKALLKFEGYDIDKTEDKPSSSKPSQEQISVRDATYELLREVRKPLHYKEIASRLFQKNINISGKNPQATLLSKISRDKRFRRTKKRGVYTLAPPSALIPRFQKRRRH